MTDKELLVLCQEAFAAMPVAARARKLLKKLDKIPQAYPGNGSHILAQVMSHLVYEHLHPLDHQ
jgi:hypothetical protein